MPVDKFGRTDIASVERTVTGGVTLSQAINTFLKRDGTNDMAGDLNMNSNSIKGLPTEIQTPTIASEAVSFGQVETLINQAIANNTITQDISRLRVTAAPTMTSNVTTIDGLTYEVSASEHRSGVEFSFEPWRAFQNASYSPKCWIADSVANVWLQIKYPVPLSMSGLYIIASTEFRGRITSWKVQASNDGTVFTDILGPKTEALDHNVLNKFTFPASSNYVYWRFHIISTSAAANWTGAGMLQWIPTLTDITLGRKCHIGYVPRLTSNTSNYGFVVDATSELLNSKAFNAFKDEGEWVANYASNITLTITCPTAVRIWKVGLKGRNKTGERIYNWRIEGSIDSGSTSILYTAPNPTYLGTTYQEFLIDSVGKYKEYTLFCTQAEAGKPGLSVMQLFVYDD